MYYNHRANRNRLKDKNYYFTKYDESKQENYDILRINHDETSRVDGEYIYDSDDDVTIGSKSRAMSTARGPRVRVLIELWSGWVGQGVCDNLELATQDNYDENEVSFERRKGTINSFEVYINDCLLYSRLQSGGYPYEDDFLEAIERARQGREVRQIRNGKTVFCTIL